MSEPIISVRKLTKSYRLYSKPSDRLKEVLWPWKPRHTLFHALHGVSFDVYKGEHLGIVGVNGAGKSTLLQILTGVLTPSSGTVQVAGRVAALLELGAGFNPDLTGRENVAFLTSLLSVSDSCSCSFLDDILNFAELDDFIDQPVKVYSSGMFARLAFAMNIASFPDILIVDEALAVGDVFFQQKCLRRMKDYREHGTILFVSHDTASVMELCKHALWLEHGGVRQFGPAKDVCEQYLASSYSASFASADSIQKAIVDCQPLLVETRNENVQQGDGIINGNLDELRRGAVSDFSDKNSFGEGGAEILKCTIENLTRESSVFSCDDFLRMIVYFRCTENISSLIAGFIFKDRLGKAIYGTNSFRYHTNWKCVKDGFYAAVFEYTLPDLASGEYLLTLAVAEGTLELHRQLHWIYDAMTIQFVSKANDGTVVSAQCIQCELIGDNHA